MKEKEIKIFLIAYNQKWYESAVLTPPQPE